MQKETTPTVAEQERGTDQSLLALMLTPDEQRPWSVDEVARELGDRIDTLDSLARLHGAG